jgi:hypothetical protein
MWSRQPRGPAGGIAGLALREPAPVLRSLFPLFYQVEIRHRQLLQSQLHPLAGADDQKDIMGMWQLRDSLRVR